MGISFIVSLFAVIVVIGSLFTGKRKVNNIDIEKEQEYELLKYNSETGKYIS